MCISSMHIVCLNQAVLEEFLLEPQNIGKVDKKKRKKYEARKIETVKVVT